MLHIPVAAEDHFMVFQAASADLLPTRQVAFLALSHLQVERLSIALLRPSSPRKVSDRIAESPDTFSSRIGA